VRDSIYAWPDDRADLELRFVHVEGTRSTSFEFGPAERAVPVTLRDFHVATTQVTQALWRHVMSDKPAKHQGARLPIENVSWDHIRQPGGFLDRYQLQCNPYDKCSRSMKGRPLSGGCREKTLNNQYQR